MKTLLNGLALLTLLTISPKLFAQYGAVKKHPVYLKKAERIPAPVMELEKAFKAKEGATVEMKFNDLPLKGKVLSSIRRYDNLYSIIIQSDANTLVSLSKRINDDRSVTYAGRIINDQSSDGYELKTNGKGTYTLLKVPTEDLIQDF